MTTPVVLNSQQLTQLQAAVATGTPGTIWKTLAGFGDLYAENAYNIIQNPTGFFGQVVTAAWEYSGADLTKFGTVASTYAVSYANQVINQGGVLPTTGQVGNGPPGIEQLYAQALTASGIPLNAAIDSTMAQEFWATTLGIEQARIQGNSAFPSTSVSSLLDKMGEFLLTGVEASADWYDYQYNVQDGQWYAVAPAPALGQFSWEDPAPANIQARLNASLSLTQAASSIDSGSSQVTITWNSPGVPGQAPVQVTANGTYNQPTGTFVTNAGATIPASELVSVSSASPTIGVAVNLQFGSGGQPSGSGVVVVPGSGTSTIVDLGSGNQTVVAGTVDTSNLQAGLPVAVTTSAGTYHVAPATGDITDSGAVTTTINGPNGPQTVTLLGTGGSSPFALISNDNTGSDASASSSNVLAYPRWSGAASMTPQPLSRRVGPSRISPVGGNRKAQRWSRDRLCGFDVREGREGGCARLRAVSRNRCSGGRTGCFGHGRGLVEPLGRPEPAAISIRGHTRRLPVFSEPAKLSGKECRSADRCRHDVSILVGGLG